MKALGLNHEIILRGCRNGRFDGFQQQIVFGFALRALRGSERRWSQKDFVARLSGSLEFYLFGGRGNAG
jgi:hypothetical protein